MWDIVDKLGPWPIMQIGVVSLIIYLSAQTYLRVLASKFPQQTQPSSPQEVSILYFQGWFKGVVDELQTIKNNQELNRIQMREYIADRLRDSRHDLRNSMAEVQAELKDDIGRALQDVRGDLTDIKSLLSDLPRRAR